MIDISGFRTTTPMEDLAIRMANEQTDYIATEVFLPHFINKTVYQWYQHDRSNLRFVNARKDSKSEADKIEFNVFNATGRAVLHKLAAEIDPNDEEELDPAVGDLDGQAVSQIMEHLLTELEQDAVTLATTASNYPSSLATSLVDGVSTWLVDGGNPIGDIKTGKTAVRATSGKIPNSLALSWETMEALRVHPSLVERAQYTGTAMPDTLIASLLGIENIYVGKARKNTANEGSADVLASVWDDDVLLYYRDAANTRQGMTYGRMFIKRDMYTHRWTDEARGEQKRIDVVELGWKYDLKIVARVSSTDADSIAGYLITNAI